MMQPTIIDVTDLCRSLSLVMAGILTACSEKHASMNPTKSIIEDETTPSWVRFCVASELSSCLCVVPLPRPE